MKSEKETHAGPRKDSYDELPVIPLWIDGHAYLTVTADFATVCRVSDGAALRRVPLCAAREAEVAIASAEAGTRVWSMLPPTQRRRLLADVAAALSSYAEHFAALIEEESGKGQAVAESEVRQAIESLGLGVDDKEAKPGVRVVAGDAAQPLSGALRWAVPAWLCGAAVVVRAPANAPSALFALAELTARCAWPAGVFNLLHGNALTDEALRLANRLRIEAD